MRALVINCSPVKNGAAAEIVNIISECLTERYEVKGICIDDINLIFVKAAGPAIVPQNVL